MPINFVDALGNKFFTIEKSPNDTNCTLTQFIEKNQVPHPPNEYGLWVKVDEYGSWVKLNKRNTLGNVDDVSIHIFQHDPWIPAPSESKEYEITLNYEPCVPPKADIKSHDNVLNINTRVRSNMENTDVLMFLENMAGCCHEMLTECKFYKKIFEKEFLIDVYIPRHNDVLNVRPKYPENILELKVIFDSIKNLTSGPVTINNNKRISVVGSQCTFFLHAILHSVKFKRTSRSVKYVSVDPSIMYDVISAFDYYDSDSVVKFELCEEHCTLHIYGPNVEKTIEDRKSVFKNLDHKSKRSGKVEVNIPNSGNVKRFDIPPQKFGFLFHMKIEDFLKKFRLIECLPYSDPDLKYIWCIHYNHPEKQIEMDINNCNKAIVTDWHVDKENGQHEFANYYEFEKIYEMIKSYRRTTHNMSFYLKNEFPLFVKFNVGNCGDIFLGKSPLDRDNIENEKILKKEDKLRGINHHCLNSQ